MNTKVTLWIETSDLKNIQLNKKPNRYWTSLPTDRPENKYCQIQVTPETISKWNGDRMLLLG